MSAAADIIAAYERRGTLKMMILLPASVSFSHNAYAHARAFRLCGVVPQRRLADIERQRFYGRLSVYRATTFQCSLGVRCVIVNHCPAHHGLLTTHVLQCVAMSLCWQRW
jgi:hypothetical protein